MELLFQLGFLVVLLAVAYIAGKRIEKNHYASIRKREHEYRNILVFNEKTLPASMAGSSFALVSGSVVVGGDFFRQWLAGIKGIFGGRLNSLESIMDRGRREAILRMKEQAHRQGADAIFNVRLNTAMLNQTSGAKGAAGLIKVELFACGTAVRRPDGGADARGGGA